MKLNIHSHHYRCLIWRTLTKCCWKRFQASIWNLFSHTNACKAAALIQKLYKRNLSPLNSHTSRDWKAINSISIAHCNLSPTCWTRREFAHKWTVTLSTVAMQFLLQQPLFFPSSAVHASRSSHWNAAQAPGVGSALISSPTIHQDISSLWHSTIRLLLFNAKIAAVFITMAISVEQTH